DSGNCFRMLVGMNNNQNVGDHIQIFSSKQTPSGRQRIASDTASEIDQNSLLRETLKKTSRFWQNTRIPPAEFPHEADDLR
ncbi:TPA: hypothetical protein ACUT4T_005944, partial [Pseudomonas aeruginosa]